MSSVLIGVLVLIFIQLSVGVWASKRSSNETDYLLAGRRIGPVFGTFTIFATWFGAETCIGAAGTIYKEGLTWGTAEPFGYGVCLLVMGFVFAMPLWRKGLTTYADLFCERFSPTVEKLVVFLLIPASLLWASAQIRAFGQVLSVLSDFDVNLSITIAAFVVISYTMYGGLRAVIVTDILQGILLIVGLFSLLLAVVWAVGGFESSAAKIPLGHLELSNDQKPFQFWTTLEAWAIPICGSVLTQELISRILASSSPQVAKKSALYGGGLYLMIGCIPVYLGLIGPSVFPNLADPEQLLPMMARDFLPPFIAMIFIGALVAAILSTVDSALLSASSLLSHNVLSKIKGFQSESRKIALARAGVVGLGIVAYIIALHAEGVYKLVETASAFGSAGIFFVGAMALFTRYGGVWAAASSIISSALIWIIGELINLDTPYLISLATAVVVYVFVAEIEKRWLSERAIKDPVY